MSDYNVKHTDRNMPSIPVPEAEVNDTALDVTLFGRINPEYGQTLDENLLNILENFSCPENSTLSTSFNNAVPDLSETSKTQLSNPTIGQFWYNSTRNMVYYWNGTVWYPLPLRENYAANWGSVMDGQQLPRPVSHVTGHVFDYEDCIWTVAPAAFVGRPAFMSCATDENAVVTMRYRLAGTNSMLLGLANYLIIGVRGNYNTGQTIPPIQPSPTPTATVSPTPQVSLTPAPSSTPMATPTPTPTIASSPTPIVTTTPVPSVTPTRTSTPIVSPTPTPTVSGFGPLVELPTSQMDVYGEVFWSSVPCPPGGQSGQAIAGGRIDVGGGSGSFTYVWTFEQDPLSNFPTNRTSVGNEFTVAGQLRSCPYQGGAFGGVSVLVTDTVTGQQATFNGSYFLEYTG